MNNKTVVVCAVIGHLVIVFGVIKKNNVDNVLGVKPYVLTQLNYFLHVGVDG